MEASRLDVSSLARPHLRCSPPLSSDRDPHVLPPSHDPSAGDTPFCTGLQMVRARADRLTQGLMRERWPSCSWHTGNLAAEGMLAGSDERHR